MATQNERATIDLIINGQQAQTTLTEVGKAATVARRELSKLREADDPGAFAKKMKEYQQLANAEADMRGRLNGAAKGWAGFKQNVVGTLTGVLGGNLLTAGLQQLVGLAPVVLEHSLKMADSFADIAKNADMSAQQVEALNEKLYKMPTRTSTEDLRKLAATGGQFGIGAKDMDAFVNGANKVQVALGDQFGDAEKTAGAVLGLRNVFTNLRSDRIDVDLLKIANGLNVLEADGAATAPVMQDFASRMGGVLIPLGLTEGKVLGLSATLQELNVTAERGSTATVNIFQKMLTNTETFAKVAGIPLKDYQKLIKTDMNDAFLAYVNGLKKVSGNQVEFMAVLEKSKLTGAGEMEVLSKLSTNTDLLAKKTDMASKALENTDSITAEYNKKNLDLAVNLKKLADLKERLLSMLTPLAEGIVSLTVKSLGLSSAFDTATKAADNQKASVKSLESQANPLIKRYDELKTKTQLSTGEQKELKSTISQIAAVIPSAVTQFDKFGNAMAISSDKAKEFVRQQQAVLKYMNKVALEETENEIIKARQKKNMALADLVGGSKRVDMGMGQFQTTALTNEELKERKRIINQQATELKELWDRKNGLSGKSLEAKPGSPAVKPGIAPPKDGPGIDLGESKEEKADRLKAERSAARTKKTVEKAADDYEKLLEQSRARTAQALDNEFEKEQIEFYDHYAKLLELAGTDKDKQLQVREAMYAELAAIQDKEDKRAEKKRKEKTEKEQKEREEELKEKTELADLYYDMAISEAERTRQKASAPAEKKGKTGLGGLLDVNNPEADQLAARQRELDAEQAFLTQKLLLQQTFGKSTVDTEKQLTDLQIEQGQRKIDAEQRFADLKRSLIEGSISSLKGLVGEHTVAYKAMMVAEKAFAIAQVWINTQKEISMIAAAPDINLLGLGAPLVKGIFTGLAYAKGAAAVASIAAVAMKDDGGFTDVDSLYGGASGFKTKPTMVNKGAGSYMVGEKRPEWIMGGAMLQNPVMANLAHALEAVQVTGAYRNMGSLPAGSAGGSQAVSGSTPGMDLTPLLYEMQLMRGELGKIKNLKVINEYRAFEEFKDELTQVRTRNTL